MLLSFPGNETFSVYEKMVVFFLFSSNARIALLGNITLEAKSDGSVKALGVTGHGIEIKMAIFLEDCIPERSALLEL